MTEVLNGQIVPALSQWQGALGIVVILGVVFMARRLRQALGSRTRV